MKIIIKGVVIKKPRGSNITPTITEQKLNKDGTYQGSKAKVLRSLNLCELPEMKGYCIYSTDPIELFNSREMREARQTLIRTDRGLYAYRVTTRAK